MTTLKDRSALARAEFFLNLAEGCSIEQRSQFEAFLEASIVFARAALHRLQSEFRAHPKWKNWFSRLGEDPSVRFFREHRDFLLKEASPKIGQIISFDVGLTACQLYYFEDPSVPATETVKRHLRCYSKMLLEGEALFRSGGC